MYVGDVVAHIKMIFKCGRGRRAWLVVAESEDLHPSSEVHK